MNLTQPDTFVQCSHICTQLTNVYACLNLVNFCILSEDLDYLPVQWYFPIIISDLDSRTIEGEWKDMQGVARP